MSVQSPPQDEAKYVIDDNPQLQGYYYSLESRIGYRLLLDGTRHFGYWERDTYWPFPISPSLRAMEDCLAEVLDLPKGSRVLDAGCGVAHVALHLAKKHGLDVTGIDVIDHHIAKAKRNIASSGLREGKVTVQKMDYHHLEPLSSESLDGAYTMETFVHATNPEAVLAGFFRVLRPGGRLALFEYDYEFTDKAPKIMGRSMQKINRYAAMPTLERSRPGVFKQMLEDAGFEDVVVRDYSEHIRPMTRLFFLIAVVPYLFITLFRLEQYFINTVAGVGGYMGGGQFWRYVAISAKKPGNAPEARKNSANPSKH